MEKNRQMSNECMFLRDFELYLSAEPHKEMPKS